MCYVQKGTAQVDRPILLPLAFFCMHILILFLFPSHAIGEVCIKIVFLINKE